jgi:hypothetical protein
VRSNESCAGLGRPNFLEQHVTCRFALCQRHVSAVRYDYQSTERRKSTVI